MAVDESKVKIERKGEPIYVYLWTARDVDTKEVVITPSTPRIIPPHLGEV
jgi:hypothetical protein